MKTKRMRRIISLALALALLPVPAFTPAAKAANAGQYQEVWLGAGRIGNGRYGATDLFYNFNSGTPGFSKSAWGPNDDDDDTTDYPKINGNTITMEHPTSFATFTVTIANNSLLQALAQSRTAQYRVTGSVWGDGGAYDAAGHNDYELGKLTVSDSGGYSKTETAGHDGVDASRKYIDSGWRSLYNLKTVVIKAESYFSCDSNGSNWNEEGPAKVEAYLYIQDTGAPTLNAYTCTSSESSAKIANASTGTNELLMKLGVKNAGNPDDYYYTAEEYAGKSADAAANTAAQNSLEHIDVNFTFNKLVTVGTPRNNGALTNGISQEDYEAFSSHTLFSNTLGTGFPRQGEPCNLELSQSFEAVNGYLDAISYRYTAAYGDFSGNNSIPDGGGVEKSNRFGSSLLQKINAAGFHDAAGNPLTGVTAGKGSNIFDRGDGGYDVIVDAMPPTYSRVSNGIEPDILTQLVLNGNDTVDFIVSFSEATITRRDWDNAKTYLMLNNGEKAYFQSKSEDGKQWIFRYMFSADKAEEASLLKVIALANDALDGSLQSDKTGKQSRSNDAAYTFDVDGRTIIDYVGNVMVERANEDSTTNTRQIQSSTGWAGLTIDNTAPEIKFTYGVYGTGALTQAAGDKWGQAAKVNASASDPDVPVAKYDPEYSSTNQTRPSAGIYRPGSTTGSTASAVGLIFYVWTRSEEAPSTGDNFEAIKRYSLTGEQPRTVDRPYAAAWANERNLMMANNFSDVVPPDEAMTSAGDGAWYLHVWTADMTWDSARQRMQYEKAKSLQYNKDADGNYYDEAGFLALKAEAIDEKRGKDVPSEDEAWAAVKETVYTTVYTERFVDWLKEYENDESKEGDRYSDAAMKYAKTEAAALEDSALLYNDTYNAASLSDAADSYKSKTINAYITENTPSRAAAWEAVRETVCGSVFTDTFRSWLKNSQITADTNEAEITSLVTSYQAEFPYQVDSNNVRYTEDTAAALKTDKISEYKNKSENEGKTDDEAWAAVREEVYKAVYTDEFRLLLWQQNNPNSMAIDYSKDDMYTDAAMTYAMAYVNDPYLFEKDSNGDDTTTRYTADTVAELKSTGIDAYIAEHTPTAEAAWKAVKATVYEVVYTERALALMDEHAAESAAPTTDDTDDTELVTVSSKADYTTEDVKYAIAQVEQYKPGFNTTRYEAFKSKEIRNYQILHTKAKPDALGYDEAWDAVKKNVYMTVYTTQFLMWLAKIDGTPEDMTAMLRLLDALNNAEHDLYTDAAMLYAKSQAMRQLTDYANPLIWQLSDYAQDDSNWTRSTARLLLDNTKPAAPAYDANGIVGDGTRQVTVPVTVSDALSGIDTASIYCQWVEKGGAAPAAENIGWERVAAEEVKTTNVSGGLAEAEYGAARATFTAETDVPVDGEYVLYVKYSDKAGNTTIASPDGLVVTVANQGVNCVFLNTASGYRNAITPEFKVGGVKTDKVFYAITATIDRPSEGYVKLDGTQDADNKRVYHYTLPALDKADGTWYLHLLVYENSGEGVEPKYFRQEYLLDRTAPTITLTPNGFTQYEKGGVTVAVKVADRHSGAGETRYQLSAGAAELAADAGVWTLLPENGKVELTEAGEWYLHVRASDQAGNAAYKVSEKFILKQAVPMVLPDYGCQLLTVADGYGVANLTLDTADKAGYRYSVSTDGGKTWCDWLPYMSMIRMKLPEGYQANGALQVKFRAPDGTVGEKKNISAQTVDNAIWATAEFDSLLTRQEGKTLTLLMTAPADVTVTAVTEGAAAADGGFTVTKNGVYEFTLSRGETTAAATFIVVVDIFDNTPPDAYVVYSETVPTRGSVLATVKSAEPIRVVSLEVTYDGESKTAVTPKAQFAFQKNGTATYTVADEAGNETTVTATVSNIDKTAPSVKIDPNYDLYKTVGESTALIASGTTLEVKKNAADDEDFTVVNNDQKRTMEATENGSYEFIVCDDVGNVGTAGHTVDNIVKTMPKYAVTYTYISDDAEVNGTTVGEDTWKRGKVQATITFDKFTDGDSRRIYAGTTPESKNALTTKDGKFVYTRTYTANGSVTLAFCDDLGNITRVPITVRGLDNTAPTLTLNKSTVSILSDATTKRLSGLTDDEVKTLLGGYTVRDNAFTTGFTVEVARSDDKSKADEDKGRLNEAGKFTLVYTVKDPAGNTSYAEQTLIVIPADGLLIKAKSGDDYTYISSSATNSAILPDNHIVFEIDEKRMQTMFYGTNKVKAQNTAMTYDILYCPGLYREGQLKTIATRLTSEQLTSRQFQVTFPKAGWYTIVIRNQERTREYTTFFIAATSKD